ncbi:rod shape-determining protein [Streptomyces sp. ISL-12]|uniref:rod shape-determining protein n=1 Tax=Streptomyces sp. ISL-12 TaxID=2819177 RepID=UPI001BE5AA0E|nr:rod shape-determining protein [Streptomyces sp. ISL-12]MBT2412251.1 rod shape-determining protein [Streptomyces sp. ISL-12]
MTVARRPRTDPGARHRPWPLCRRCCGLALDLGSVRTRAWISGRGAILDVPTVTFPGAGAHHPVQRGAIVDVPGTARMLDRLLGHRLPRLTRPLVVVTTPVLDGPVYRERARAAVRVLRPRAVLTVPSARAVALAAEADLTRPLLVVDIGAHLTEVVLLSDGAVFDARRTALGTVDLADADADTDTDTDAAAEIGEAVATMVASMLRQDRTFLTADALSRGALLAGGGALRPDLTRRLIDRLRAPLRVVPAPHTAAVRGAARILRAAHGHPSAGGTLPPGFGPLPR